MSRSAFRAGRYSKLNLINLEAAAAARLLDARVLLSPLSAAGVLPGVLEAESVAWEVVAPSG